MFSTKFAVLSTDFVESSSSLNIHFSEKMGDAKGIHFLATEDRMKEMEMIVSKH